MTTEHPTDVVVIGGGIAGLTAAALIGHRGRRVRLFEKAGELGGRAVTPIKPYACPLGEILCIAYRAITEKNQ